MRDTLMHSIILAYVTIALVLTWIWRETFSNIAWHVIEFFQTVNHVVNILSLPA